MPKPNKPKNAYSFFVAERCAQSGTHYSQGFSKFSDAWDRMGPQERKPYFDQAEAERKETTTVPGSSYEKKDYAAKWLKQKPPVDKIVLGHKFGTRDTEKDCVVDGIIIPEVAHGIGEYMMADGKDKGAGDMTAPSYDSIEAACVYAVKHEYPAKRNLLVQKVIVIGCVPLIPVGYSANPVYRPLEICLRSFYLTTGFSNAPANSFHAFVDPGPVAPEKQLALMDARKSGHKIPHAEYIKSDEECKMFHQGFKLRNDYYDLYKEMTDFAQANHRPIVVLGSMVDIASSWACMEWLHYQATEEGKIEGRPTLDPLKLSTVDDYCGNAIEFHLTSCPDLGGENLILEEFERVRKTFDLRRYTYLRHLHCSFHKQVDAELCADAIAGDRIFSIFDVLRDHYDLPNDGPFAASQDKQKRK